MITLSTNEIQLKSSPEELFTFLGTLEGISEVFEYKKVKQKKIVDDKVEFILRNAAIFKFSIGEITNEYVQINSIGKDVPFMTAFRFDIASSNSGSALQIHLETDTSPVIDFTFERRAKNWLAAVTQTFESKFN